MSKTIQKRLSLLVEARRYAEKMHKGPAFVTDFKAMRLLNEMIEEMQKMLGENLKLEEELKTEITFKKNKKEHNK
tara:strand:- start:540 stop:764 length:225 start_codon:yes stop_codon:yes gene_type:complete